MPGVSCLESHATSHNAVLWVAIGYGERNPVRACMVARPEDYRWSSARAHLTGVDESGVLDMDFWRREGGAERWRCLLADRDELDGMRALEASTYAGRPFGDEDFVAAMASRFGRDWGAPGRVVSARAVG